MDEPQIMIESLHLLRNFGVQIAIDDFGTGFFFYELFTKNAVK